MPVKSLKRKNRKTLKKSQKGGRGPTKRSKKTLKRKNKGRKQKVKRHNTKHKQLGGKCDYVTLKGMNISGLDIPEQYARVSECTESVQVSPTAHPGMNLKA